MHYAFCGYSLNEVISDIEIIYHMNYAKLSEDFFSALILQKDSEISLHTGTDRYTICFVCGKDILLWS